MKIMSHKNKPESEQNASELVGLVNSERNLPFQALPRQGRHGIIHPVYAYGVMRAYVIRKRNRWAHETDGENGQSDLGQTQEHAPVPPSQTIIMWKYHEKSRGGVSKASYSSRVAHVRWSGRAVLCKQSSPAVELGTTVSLIADDVTHKHLRVCKRCRQGIRRLPGCLPHHRVAAARRKQQRRTRPIIKHDTYMQ